MDPLGSNPAKIVVVVGSGLAGASCALELASKASLIDSPIQILLMEKETRLGGNSTKASSGMNAMSPETGDSVELFESDVMASGGGLSSEELVQTLVRDSPAALQFLSSYGIDISTIVQLGGHSVPRTHTTSKGGSVGFVVMRALHEAVAREGAIRVETHCRLTGLLLDPTTNRVQGVRFVRSPPPPATGAATASPQEQQEETLLASAVVLATGGFGANREMLSKYCGEGFASLATTNGPFASGDALPIAESIGAQLVQMEQVQVHPTGFVDPSDPSARTRFLAPEKLRGVGGLLLSHHGRRFVDELATRERVMEAIGQLHGGRGLMTTGPLASVLFLLLSSAAAERYGLEAIQFYASKGLFKAVQGLEGLAQEIGCMPDTLQGELEAYNRCCRGEERDDFGKRVFPCDFPTTSDATFYVARVTPVIHYCMGGIKIDPEGRVVSGASASGSGRPIEGLFAAGEVTGGLHGRNRLGGNSLLECVVYGRRCAGSIVEHLQLDAAEVAGTQLLGVHDGGEREVALEGKGPDLALGVVDEEAMLGGKVLAAGEPSQPDDLMPSGEQAV